MSSYIRQRVKAHVQAVKSKLDAQAQACVDDLVARCLPIKSIRCYAADQDDLGTNVVRFKGQDTGFITGDMTNALELLESDRADIEKNQFDTVEEIRRYCYGTRNLFSILMQYHRIRTEHALIMACPDARIFRGGKASITPEDLRQCYDKKRAASVVVVFNDGFICFSFEEKLVQ